MEKGGKNRVIIRRKGGGIGTPDRKNAVHKGKGRNGRGKQRLA